MNEHELITEFNDQYGQNAAATRMFFAPGRVNLLGDHTDYNGGLVFPCAINYGTALLIRKRNDQLIKLSSRNFSLVAFLSAQELLQKYGDHWINYPLGVIDQFRQRGVDISGFELMYSGDIPNGAGLSSSASVEVVTAFAFNELLQLGMSDEEVVRLALAAENEFVGVNCGIMDQYASAMGQKGHAMKLDCATLACEQVPIDLVEHCFVIVNSNQRRELTESGYNERFAESREVLALLQKHLDVSDLANVSIEQLEQHKAGLSDLLYRRVRHVITEHNRVEDSVKYLKAGNLVQFGQLMDESHISMKDDYEMSTDIIDTLVNLARSQTGVLGARLTGGGFGGCIVALIEKSHIDNFTQNLSQAYKQQTGLSADIYPVNLEQGAREVML